MFIEVASRVIALDFGFLIDFVLGNLFWAFAFVAVMQYFLNGKKVFRFALFYLLMLWAWGDLQTITGLVWTSASFLLLYYMTKLAVIALAESTPALKKYVIIITTLQAYIVFLAFNFFLR